MNDRGDIVRDVRLEVEDAFVQVKHPLIEGSGLSRKCPGARLRQQTTVLYHGLLNLNGPTSLGEVRNR